MKFVYCYFHLNRVNEFESEKKLPKKNKQVVKFEILTSTRHIQTNIQKMDEKARAAKEQQMRASINAKLIETGERDR